jgi:NADH-quinone oxidoreductase subunit F
VADLHFTDARATDAEQATVDAAIGADGAAVVHEGERLVRGGTSRRRERRHLLLPALHALQHEIGWISPGGLNHVADRLQVPPAEAYGVATFYELFRTDEPEHPGPVTHVCVDPACRIAGAEGLAARVEADGGQVHRGPCLGQCERAPARFVQGVGTPDEVPADATTGAAVPQAGDPGLRLLQRIGVVDPDSIDAYRDHGGYDALARAIELGPEAVIDAVDAAGLSGRGGAAFPTGRKWRAVRDADGPVKHVVANCDESEPGTSPGWRWAPSRAGSTSGASTPERRRGSRRRWTRPEPPVCWAPTWADRATTST